MTRLEQDPCNTCGYEEGSIYCKEHCPHEAKIEQETVFFPPCQDCNTKMDEIRRAYDKLQEPSGDAIDRKIISAFLSGLISDDAERKKALEYIRNMPPVIHHETVTEFADRCKECGRERVLDKIRAEIEQLRLHKAQFLTSDNKVCIDSQDVLNVIDKYRAESSEDRE